MKDLTDGKLDEALAFANKINDNSLQGCIDRLKRTEENYKEDRFPIEISITTDFAPYSFYFVKSRKNTNEFVGNGGIIFHGKHDNGGDGGAPTFSVNLTPTTGWAIHT